MRILWTLFKVALGIAIAIPLGFFAISLALGVVGTVLALVSIAVRLACVGLLAYGVYRVARFFFGGRAKPPVTAVRDLPSADPYYSAAMRELDAELRH
jgi:hypothetical protein